MSVVDVELLVVPDCPNESVALSVLRLAFDRVGLAALSVRTTVIASQEQAQECGFVGSPTILINGVDPFVTAGQSPAYACRVYATPAGLSGVPPLDDVISALPSPATGSRLRPNELSTWRSPGPAHDGSRREADLRDAAGGPGSPPAGDHGVWCHADVSMTLGIFSNASPMATREAKRRLGEPLQVLLLALCFGDDLRELWSG
jgi:hypothetical protein